MLFRSGRVPQAGALGDVVDDAAGVALPVEERVGTADDLDTVNAGHVVESAAGGEAKAAAEAKPAAGSGWGTIKGKIVWSGASMPDKKNLEVQKDTEWCLKAGAIPDETIVVDEATKGVLNVYIYLRKPTAIHPDYPQKTADVKAEIGRAHV